MKKSVVLIVVLLALAFAAIGQRKQDRITDPQVLIPVAGHCPIDGTEGLDFGRVMLTSDEEDDFRHPTPVLRCQHCGLLFTRKN